MKCWKIIDNAAEQAVIKIGADTYAQQEATGQEIALGNGCLMEWSVELLYEVQVCGPNTNGPYLDRKSKPQEVPFNELIFRNGECIGICHEECIMLFDDETTHFHEKFIGEFITGPDRTHCAYDHYRLKRGRVG